MTATAAKVAGRDLCCRFPASGGDGAEVVALDHVDFAVEERAFVSIIGPSGCGKSTLFNIVAGLVQPTSGTVELDDLPARDLLGRVGYMPQHHLLMPWRTVLDNAIVGLELTGVGRREARERARALFPKFGLAGFEDAWPSTLSGGMRQRAALLRTFLAGRDVLLLDEPFGALDALTRQAMHTWLLEVWAEFGKTILLVTHDVDEALLLSDRVYVMSPRPGRIELVVEVDLERPRTLAMTVSDRFVELKAALMEPLQGVHGARTVGR